MASMTYDVLCQGAILMRNKENKVMIIEKAEAVTDPSSSSYTSHRTSNHLQQPQEDLLNKL